MNKEYSLFVRYGFIYFLCTEKSMTNSNWLRVPVELANKLDEIAERKGIIARGKWAVYARTVLTEHITKEERA